MKTPKLLFVEPRSYYEELGVWSELSDRFLIEFPDFFLNKTKDKIERGYYDALVTCVFHSDLSRLLTELSNNNSVLTIYFMDGIGDFSNFINNSITRGKGVKQLIPPIHALNFCVDESTCKYLSGLGYKSSLYINERVLSSVDQHKELPKKERFMITLANSPAFDDDEVAMIKKLIASVSIFLHDMGIDFVYRLFDKEFIPREFLFVENRVNNSLEESITDITCFFTSASSVVLPFMRLNFPVCIFDYRDTPLFIQSGWRLTSPKYTGKVIESMLTKDKDRMLYQNSVVANYDGVESISSVVTDNIIKSDIKYGLRKSKLIFVFNFETVFRFFYRKVKRNLFFKKIISKLRR